MTKTVFEPSIKTRPVYGELKLVAGAEHLFICDSDGLEVALNCMKGAKDSEWARTQLVLIGKTNAKEDEELNSKGLKSIYRAPSFDAAQQALHDILSAINGRTQIYLSGGETTIGRSKSAAMAAGVSVQSIQTEHRGSTKRRMQCVHCKGITEDVTHDPFQCSHCGLHLFVRDHYSIRLAAFQGVCVDAEDPGNIPEAVERFS